MHVARHLRAGEGGKREGRLLPERRPLRGGLLRVGVDQQHLAAAPRNLRRHVQGDCSLTDAALLIKKRNNHAFSLTDASNNAEKRKS